MDVEEGIGGLTLDFVIVVVGYINSCCVFV